MDNRTTADLFSASLNLAGAGVLAFEAMRARRQMRSKTGLQALLDAVGKIKMRDKTQINDVVDLQYWFANRTMRYAWVGFGLLCVGFIVDLIGSII